MLDISPQPNFKLRALNARILHFWRWPLCCQTRRIVVKVLNENFSAWCWTNAKWLQKSSILHIFKVPQCLQTPSDPPKCRFVGSTYGLKVGYIWMWLSFISHLILVKAFDRKPSKMQSALNEKGVVWWQIPKQRAYNCMYIFSDYQLMLVNLLRCVSW